MDDHAGQRRRPGTKRASTTYATLETELDDGFFARRLFEDRSPAAVAMTRQMIRRNPALNEPLDAHRPESLAMSCASVGDGREGVAAFIAKRPPVFDQPASPLPEPKD